MQPQPNQTPQQRDLRIFDYFTGIKTKNWYRKRLGQLLARKYGRNSTTRHQVLNWLNLAQRQFRLTDINPPMNVLNKQKILIKRMLVQDYNLQQNDYYRKANKKQKIKCQICEKQLIKFIYRMLFKGDQERVNQKLDVGIQCVQLIQSLRSNQLVQLFNHRLVSNNR